MTSAASAMTARGLAPWPATRAAPPRPSRGFGGGGRPRALSRRAASGAASGDASPALPPRGTNALQEDADGAPHDPGTLTYYLVDVDYSGVATVHGPATVEIPGPEETPGGGGWGKGET